MSQTITIFLASSAELKDDREKFEQFIGRKNKTLIEHDRFIKLVIWEDFIDAISQTRLQDEYNKAIRESDIFVMLFATKVGQYTREEYETAFGQFRESNKPLIYTYFKKAPVTLANIPREDVLSLWDFQDRLKTLGHYYSEYEDSNDLINQFNNQLEKLDPFKGKGYNEGEKSPQTKVKKIKSPSEILQVYKNWFNEFHSTVSFDQLAKKGEALPVQLLDIYIPLETQSPFYKPEMEEKDQSRKTKTKKKADQEIAAVQEPKEPQMIDIEVLISRTDNLLLRGNAGTGKTTLVKHLVNTILQNSCPPPLRGFLPVLVFCKDLWQVYKEICLHGKKIVTYEELLPTYLAKTQSGLTWEVVTDYLARQKTIFFFDGLDEAPAAWRDNLVDLIASLRLNHPHNRFVLTGRPHGLEGKVNEKFGTFLRDIAPLNETQVAEYIHKWFQVVSGKAQGMANVNAADMLADIRQHEHIAVFTQNPLLLAAVCVLYLSGKRIPEQRADLYNRIVENLLWRRFHDALEPQKEIKVEAYLMKLAFSMHDKGQRTIEEDGAKAELRVMFPKLDKISDEIYYLEMDKLFQEIEPNCGLLNRLSDGQIEFFHLTFQEFLAAKYLANRELPCKSYLDNPWWEEAVILYLGLQNLTRQKYSNDIIVHEIYNGQGVVEPWRVLMGAKALRDFQMSRREKEAVNAVQGKLLESINSGAPLKVRFEAGDLLGAIGDPRLPTLEDGRMVLVPAGEFMRGSEENDHEKPVRRIYLDDYYIGRYQVTNQEFKRFLADKGYQIKDFWSQEGWRWRETAQITEPAILA